MKNLGKILFTLLLLQTAIYADVIASVDYNKVTIGETVTYSIKSTNANIDRPLIDTICSTNVIATSSQTNIEMVNGGYTRTKIFNYKFMPRKSCTIQPISLSIDGKIQKTDAIEITVVPATQDKNADFVIELQSNTTDVFVGQPFVVDMLVKQKHNARALDSKFIAPKMNGFWVSGEPQQSKYDDGTFMITKLSYKISAQHAGSLNITPAQLAVAKRSNVRDSWGSFMQDVTWKSYFSNSLKIKAKAIPQGAKFIGNFSISANVDKTEVNPNEAINVTIQVHGDGNLEDIETFKPSIQDVSVFDEKPVVKGDEFTQKIALVGDNDFLVPAFRLTFYNPKTKKKETIQTQEIKITVHGTKPKQALEIQRGTEIPTPAQQKSVVSTQKEFILWQAIVIFISGIFFGVLLMFFKPWQMMKREKSFDIKDEKKLLIKLLPYKEDAEVQIITDILEHNIYSKTKQEVDKKLLKAVLKRYDIL